MLGVALRRFGVTAMLAATSQLVEGPLFLIEYALQLARVAVLLSLWRLLLHGQGSVSGLTLRSVLTYTLIAEVFAEQLAVRTGLQQAGGDSALPQRLLQPMSLVSQFASDMCGQWCFGLLLFSLPLLACSSPLGVDPAPANPVAAGLFVVSLALGISVGLALELIFGGLVVANDGAVWLIDRTRTALGTVLSGALVPLALLPWGLGDPVRLAALRPGSLRALAHLYRDRRGRPVAGGAGGLVGGAVAAGPLGLAREPRAASGLWRLNEPARYGGGWRCGGSTPRWICCGWSATPRRSWPLASPT